MCIRNTGFQAEYVAFTDRGCYKSEHGKRVWSLWFRSVYMDSKPNQWRKLWDPSGWMRLLSKSCRFVWQLWTEFCLTGFGLDLGLRALRAFGMRLNLTISIWPACSTIITPGPSCGIQVKLPGLEPFKLRPLTYSRLWLYSQQNSDAECNRKIPSNYWGLISM